MSDERRARTRRRLETAPEVRPAARSEAPTSPARELPEECPVRPLGMLASDTPTAVLLSAAGTVVKLTGQALGQGNIDALFAPRNDFLARTWPRISKSGDVDGFRAERALDHRAFGLGRGAADARVTRNAERTARGRDDGGRVAREYADVPSLRAKPVDRGCRVDAQRIAESG